MAKKKSKRPPRRGGAKQKKPPAAAARTIERFVEPQRIAMEEPTPGDPDAASVLPEFSIVGVGASAGGLEACSQLLAELPKTNEFAIVIVQHLAPEHESVLPELLSGASSLPVIQARD